MSAHNPIKRRPTKKIHVGNVAIGGDAPISVQSMTNTNTCDVAATVAQIQRCVDAGADLMRVSTPTMESVAAFAEIKKQVSVPLIADIHFDYKIALAVADAALTACVSTQVISAMMPKCVKWWRLLVIIMCQFASG